MNVEAAVIMTVIIIVIVIGVIIIIQHLKTKDTNQNEKQAFYDEESDEDDTVLMQDDEDDTILMQDNVTDIKNGENEATLLGRTLVLISEQDSSEYTCRCMDEIKIGRKEICDICILGDKAVSGVHCIVTCDYSGELKIRDNNSSNGTFLNDEKLIGEKMLTSGDSLEIGRTRYGIRVL